VLGFAETLGAVLASFLAPTFVGLLIMAAAARVVAARYLAAFALGLYFWFFTDTIGDANLLGVNEGFTGGAFHVVLWAVFVLGILFFFSLDGNLFAAGHEGTSLGFAIPVLVGLAVGIHGFGEGAAIGGTAATTPSANLLDAFGGISAAVAFILHKGLEPMMMGAAYWVYAGDHARGGKALLKDILVLTGAFSAPGIIGGGLAYYLVQVYPNADFTYVFAFGLGTSLYAAARLARPLFEGTGRDGSRIAIAIAVGFTCLYLAALLHS
jgi:hypothetical protein